LDERDVVIAISYSGESEAVLRVAKEAKKNGTRIVAITRVGENSLGKLADRILAVPNSESLFRQGATLSRINQLLVVDIVYATILSRIQEEASGIITRTWEAVSHVSGKDTSRSKI
jgi:DNA-binding MurR/RpiR family transcriptional regulator